MTVNKTLNCLAIKNTTNRKIQVTNEMKMREQQQPARKRRKKETKTNESIFFRVQKRERDTRITRERVESVE